MSEAKFTQGEWSVYYGLVVINRVHYEFRNTHDAHLIAAAPEMYMALKQTNEELAFMIERYNRRVKDPANFIDAETCHKNQVLLAKARGEA